MRYYVVDESEGLEYGPFATSEEAEEAGDDGAMFEPIVTSEEEYLSDPVFKPETVARLRNVPTVTIEEVK